MPEYPKTQAMLEVERRRGPIEWVLRRLYWERGLTYQEVGDQLDLSRGTIQKWMSVMELSPKAVAHKYMDLELELEVVFEDLRRIAVEEQKRLEDSRQVNSQELLG
jgi:hypothetical protein